MLDTSGIFSNFKLITHCMLDEFKKLPLIDQLSAVELFEKCLNEMRKTVEVAKLSPVKDETAALLVGEPFFKSPVKCSLSGQLNVLTGSDLNLHEPVQDIYSDSERDDTNDLSDSSVLQKRVSLIVQKLESDDAFLAADIPPIHDADATVNPDQDKFENADESADMSDDAETKTGPSNSTCALCIKQLGTHPLLIEHIFQHIGTKQSCLKCRNTFENIISYNYHLENMCNTGINFSIENLKNQSLASVLCCPYCGKRFSKTYNLRRHLKTYCESDNMKFQCDICHKTFFTENMYLKHTKKSSIVCKKCSKIFCSKALLKQHDSSVCESVYNFSCEVCKIFFPSRSKFREHMKINSQNEEHKQMKKSIGPDVWCKPCTMSFVDEKSYKKHCKSKNHLKATNQQLPELAEFICEKCGKGFTDKSILIGHIKKLHENKMLKCDKCPYSTRATSNMKRHKNFLHNKVPKKFACDQCPMFYDSSSKLKDHMMSIHSQERLFPCDLCDKTFKQKNQLTQHKRIHDSVLPFTCNQCFAKFRRQTHLQRHIMARHDDGIIRKIEQSTKKVKQPKLMETSVTEVITNMENEQVFSCMDVQSGELVMLSNTEMLKNYVVNISAEGDLLNNVHIPEELWENPNEMYIQPNPILPNPQTAYMIPPQDSTVQEASLIEGSKREYVIAEYVPDSKREYVVAEYVPDYIHLPSSKNEPAIEMLTGGDQLTQGTLNSDLIVSNQTYENIHNLPMPTYYGNMNT